jgi:hypothetical protein
MENNIDLDQGKNPMKSTKPKSGSGVRLASGKRQEPWLELPGGEPDLEALRSVMREWLVPQLVEKFLRLHGSNQLFRRRLHTSQPRTSSRVGITRRISKNRTDNERKTANTPA